MIGFGSDHYSYDSEHEGDALVIGLPPRSAAVSVYGLDNADDPDPRCETLGPHRVGEGLPVHHPF